MRVAVLLIIVLAALIALIAVLLGPGSALFVMGLSAVLKLLLNRVGRPVRVRV